MGGSVDLARQQIGDLVNPMTVTGRGIGPDSTYASNLG